MNKNIRINVEVRDNTKELFGKKVSILDCELNVPTVDPTKLNPFDEDNNKIYCVVVKPVVNRVNKYSDGTLVPDTGVSGLNTVAVDSVLVKSVASITIGDELCARINGTIDMPLKGFMKRATLDKAWFTDQDMANSVCMAAAEIELEKALKMKEEVDGAVKVLNAITDLYGSAESKSVSSKKRQFRAVEVETSELDGEALADVLEDTAQAIRHSEE